MKLSFFFISFLFSIFILVSSCKKDAEVIAPEDNTFSLNYMSSWNLASVPLRFPESNLTSNTTFGFNRAKIAWYIIDPNIFYDRSANLRPPNLSKNDMSADDCRVIYEWELLPNKENPYEQPLPIYVFNIDYYPSERGFYNYETEPTLYSSGISFDGKLNEPETRWAGIFRKLDATDYNINYLDFWILDPFTTYPDANGELVFDIGDISEDILKDGMISAENTTEGTGATSVWGSVRPISSTNSFPANNPAYFDTGLDELFNEDETTFFLDYVSKINSLCDPAFYTLVNKDPANDDYHSYLGDDYTEMNYKIRDRYKNFNGCDLNSFPTPDGNSIISQRTPNSEDINNNGILDTLNNYWEYKIHINKESLQVGSNFVVDIYDNPKPTKLESGYQTNPKFYHFRILLSENTSTYGTPDLSSNPKFIRLYLTGFSSPVNIRFINLMFSEEIIDYSLYQKHY